MRSHTTRREDARLLNRLIDRALTRPTSQYRQEVVALATDRDVERLGEHIRRRATWLGRHDRAQTQHILAVRDELIMALYAALAPKGWANAWCDGSSTKKGTTHRAGIGAMVMDAKGKQVSQISRDVGDNRAFEAEIVALTAALEMATAYHIERLCVHTDCKALVQLWQQQRQDPRLTPLHQLSSQFKQLHIKAIPRQHNQLANTLAKQAISNKLNS